MDESYNKGKTNGQKDIGLILSQVNDAMKSADDVKSVLSYLWGVRDSYSETLATYMPGMVQIKLPADISGVEQSMYWEMASHIMVFFDTIRESDGDKQYLYTTVIRNLVRILTEIADNRTDVETTTNMLYAMRDHIDDALSERKSDGSE